MTQPYRQGIHTFQAIPPKMPVTAVKTYGIRVPDSGWRVVRCEEVSCPNHINGWRTTVDESTDLGRKQAGYVRHHSGRHFTESRNSEGLTVFTFKPEQQCFKEHKVRNDMPASYIKRAGDFRGNPDGTITRIPSDQAWVDDFGENQERLTDEIKKGIW